MPVISRFYGIIISMFFSDHNPPHFHVRYESHKCIISIKDLVVLDGRIPPRALGLVIEWASKHQEDLYKSWEKAFHNQDPDYIEPLD